MYEPNIEYGNLYVYMLCTLSSIVAMIINNTYFDEELDVKNMEALGKIVLADYIFKDLIIVSWI